MRRLFVPVFFGLVIALGVSSAQAGNQEEANKIAQRLTQQYPQYNIEVAYQEGKVRLRGEVGSEADKAEIANFVRRIPKVRSVSETMTVSAGAAYVEAAPAIQYAEPATGIRSVQALTPATPAPAAAPAPALPASPVAPAAAPAAPVETPFASSLFQLSSRRYFSFPLIPAHPSVTVLRLHPAVLSVVFPDRSEGNRHKVPQWPDRGSRESPDPV